MFKVNPDRTFKRSVTVFYPTDNPNKHDSGVFVAVFKQLDEDRIEQLQEEGNSRFIDEILVGAEKVGDAEGNQIPSDQAVELIKQDSCSAAATIAEYIECTVKRNTKRKN